MCRFFFKQCGRAYSQGRRDGELDGRVCGMSSAIAHDGSARCLMLLSFVIRPTVGHGDTFRKRSRKVTDGLASVRGAARARLSKQPAVLGSFTGT